jgi:uncharacterized membrane protein
MIAAEQEHLARLRAIVEASIEEQDLIVNNQLNPPRETLTRGQELSDRIARWGGSWAFILFFLALLAVWVIYNVSIARSNAFDPYPFILMNLLLSCIAALQAPIIMMSQNRKEEKDRMRAENDYLVNLKAELQIRGLQQKMDLLIREELATLYKSQAQQLVILERLEKRIDKDQGRAAL